MLDRLIQIVYCKGESTITSAFQAKLLHEAEHFIHQCYSELGKTTAEIDKRTNELHQEIARHGSYIHTFEELEHGARMAWRNSNRCIGRLFWNRLHLFDARNLKTEEEVFNALLRHIEYATNNGEIRPVITVFAQEHQDEKPVIIWNHQLLRYAGYEQENGEIIGDPASLAFTKACEALGWKGKGSPFDVLPLVIQCNGNAPKLFELPEELVLEVPIVHPEHNIFAEMEVKWYAVPIISDMKLEIGGIGYTAAPFNGWYMGTEIGARNLADASRYHMLPKVAGNLGLNTASHASLWKDRALVELNIAVLHSFREHKVSIVDHHTAAQQFAAFERKEHKEGRELTGRWSWLIPPLSPATTHLFHSTYDDRLVLPNFFSQPRQFE